MNQVGNNNIMQDLLEKFLLGKVEELKGSGISIHNVIVTTEVDNFVLKFSLRQGKNKTDIETVWTKAYLEKTDETVPELLNGELQHALGELEKMKEQEEIATKIADTMKTALSKSFVGDMLPANPVPPDEEK